LGDAEAAERDYRAVLTWFDEYDKKTGLAYRYAIRAERGLARINGVTTVGNIEREALDSNIMTTQQLNTFLGLYVHS
jgi:hypothetical protein